MKRITIMLDDDNVKKLRILQAQLLKKSTKSVSFSSVITDVLRKEL
jgi:hypothetical protein